MDKDNFGLKIDLDLYFFTIIFEFKPLDWKFYIKTDLYPNDNMFYIWFGCFQFGLFW